MSPHVSRLSSNEIENRSNPFECRIVLGDDHVARGFGVRCGRRESRVNGGLMTGCDTTLIGAIARRNSGMGGARDHGAECENYRHPPHQCGPRAARNTMGYSPSGMHEMTTMRGHMAIIPHSLLRWVMIAVGHSVVLRH